MQICNFFFQLGRSVHWQFKVQTRQAQAVREELALATAATQVSEVLPLATRALVILPLATRADQAAQVLSTRALGSQEASAVQDQATRGVSALPAEATRGSEIQRGIRAPLWTREDGEPQSCHQCSREKWLRGVIRASNIAEKTCLKMNELSAREEECNFS